MHCPCVKVCIPEFPILVTLDETEFPPVIDIGSEQGISPILTCCMGALDVSNDGWEGPEIPFADFLKGRRRIAR